MTSVLHTWGSALVHHPHVHMIVPGGGLSKDGNRWVACKPGFFLHVRVLSRLFRRLFIEGLLALHCEGELNFFGDLAGLYRCYPKTRIFSWVMTRKLSDTWSRKAFHSFGMVSRKNFRIAFANRFCVG